MHNETMPLEDLIRYFEGRSKNLTKQTPMKQTTPNQNVVLNHVRNAGFIIGSIDATGNLSFASNPMVHPDAISARKECKRLADITPGKAFTFVQFRGAELVPMAQSVSI